ncbi:peptidylprolyl isomerase [Stakelama sp. CBK3Z-3]|uniref:peptidylprolyl isomerase n=2 Tax=Stakelama flava TaxID=2860338 RepID=A0ABS6XHC4_9SPHN|nr:peptidylprolyl isomerase [Stakelama flava]
MLVASAALAQDAPSPIKGLPDPYAGWPRVELDTSAGKMVVAVDTKDAPITAKNFLHYVDSGRMNGAKFYRIVKVDNEFGFVQFGMQTNPKKLFPPIKHEPTTETGLHHTDGTLSMPRLKPGTAQGEFTITLGDQRPSFDAHPEASGDNLGYAAFGKVVEGRDVLVSILDTPLDPEKNDRGAFKGEMPADPVIIVKAKRLAE